MTRLFNLIKVTVKNAEGRTHCLLADLKPYIWIRISTHHIRHKYGQPPVIIVADIGFFSKIKAISAAGNGLEIAHLPLPSGHTRISQRSSCMVLCHYASALSLINNYADVLKNE